MGTSRQKLEEVIAFAISLIYSEEYEFEDAVIEIVMRQHVSAIEAYVALSAAASTKDGGSYDIEASLGTIKEVVEAEDSEMSLILWDMCETKAKRDFLSIQAANEFLRIASEAQDMSFGGAVYIAEKLKNGPLTMEERQQLLIQYPFRS